MIFQALSEAAQRGELLLVADGLCRWHKRRDGVVTIHEILVLPFRWQTGIGRRLVQTIQAQNPGATLRAKCPASYEANRFWEHLGFRIVATTKGIHTWERSP